MENQILLFIPFGFNTTKLFWEAFISYILYKYIIYIHVYLL